MDPTRRFSQTVDCYVAHRPDYPEALFDWLAAHVRGRAAADLGAGTGISTRLLADRGWDVIGVEPNADMRAAATRAGRARYVDGRAEQTGLPDRSVDLVLGAQAFHWFDLDRALSEIDRIGRELAVAVWNVRSPDGFAAAYEAALVRFSEEYRRVRKPEATLADLHGLRPGGLDVALPHGQDLDRDGVLGRAWSSSYVVHGVTDKAGFDGALLDAFAAHEVEGRVRLGYVTLAYGWMCSRRGMSKGAAPPGGGYPRG